MRICVFIVISQRFLNIIIFNNWHKIIFNRKFHLSKSNIYFEKTFGLLHVPYLHTNVPHCHHVLGFILDSPRSCASKGDTGRYKPVDTLNTACQKFIFATTCVLYQSHRYIYGFLYNLRFPVAHGICTGECVVGKMCSDEAKAEIVMS